ncbi:secreted protein [Streptomyces sviceus ATCC 29083]|uniref:Secreted protein n=1 Tax=Streptomyces sviceus (strain ATCC 29083 / DSM 924 / JCM 4929 / NBRC 13980 / NCIMB 11184 / NRRL 5439 / UC 5370) TaxID=463191 RepID=B5I1Y2_STRX2|nr:secreted protein [Streptomyces sviceus ATCC 29083]
MRFAGVAVAVAGVLVAAGAITYAVAEDGGSGDTPSAESADAGFARDMAVHHQQAVEMSYIVRDRTKDVEVRRLAYDIAQTQANQRGMLLGWLDLWQLPKVSADPPMTWMDMGDMPSAGEGSLMPGMATDSEMKKLGTLNGKQAEIFYLQLMTDHHQGGIHMAKGCVEKCTVGVEKRLAQGMVAAQQSEIDLMAGMLKERGANPR